MGAADTIYALSSAAGKAGVSIVRVSGAGAFASLHKITGSQSHEPRAANVFALNDKNGKLIDRALVISFKGPNSFTGEDVVEYHVHGSQAVLEALFETLSVFDGHRMASGGEFTRRAFENGKMDLTAAEAIADLIDAQTQAQREQALNQMDGGLARLYESWRTELVKIMAYIEAVIDFPDEDVPDSQIATQIPALQKLIREISAHLDDGHRGERLRDGIQIAILGAPNAGKSSLLNALAKRDVAIVSPMAGTTRDIIEAHLNLGGYPVILADTAGLRAEELKDDGGHGSVESEGIKRALKRADSADIKILLFDGTEETPNINTLSLKDENSIVVFTKKDDLKFAAKDGIAISSMTNDGIDGLIATLTQKIAKSFSDSRETPSLTRARHRDALEETLQRLEHSLTAKLPELMAEDIRMAARGLGRITGRVDVEDLLDVIFRDFCIGK